MTKKKRTGHALVKDNVALGIAAASLVIGLGSFVWANVTWGMYQDAQRQIADQFFELQKKDVMHEHCLEHDIKPCTSEAINQNAGLSD